MKHLKPYKEAIPKNTILKIQNILNDLNILTVPVVWNNPFNNIYSVRLEALEEFGGFGTNGKGKNKLFALASAHAEFIERIQNLFISGPSGYNKFFLQKIKNKTGFYYFPDEKLLNIDDFKNIPPAILNDFFPIKKGLPRGRTIEQLFSILKEEDRNGIISVPFYRINSLELKYIPYNFVMTLTGSNGMAAGNTISEATFQAMCEIYERNAASIVYYKNLTPPSISEEFIKINFVEEYKIIQEIKRYGFDVFVKDFSCGLKLPVIGLIILDKVDNIYRLNIGSDTCFKTALSRTLTEIFQGLNHNNFKDKFLEIPNKVNAPYLFDNVNVVDKNTNFRMFLKNGKGFFPLSLFGNKNSYDFDSTTFFPSTSYEEDVKYLLKLGANLGYDIYLRDVSFLGFPSVYIYIPNVSLLGDKNIYNNDSIDGNTIMFNSLESYLFPFDKFINNEKKIKNVINILKELNLTHKSNNDFRLKDILRLEFKKGSDWDTIPINYFLSILYILIKDYKNGRKYLNEFINQNNLKNIDYYNQVLKYLNLLETNSSLKNIPSEIINSFKDSASIFSFINYPSCPNCSDCKLSNVCLTKINIDNSININIKAKESVVNQYKFNMFN
jgi:YcaO-like protein with predicted kinase domain